MNEVQAERLVSALEKIALALQPQPQPAQAPAGSCPQCGGPEDKQVDAGTMGNPGLKKCLLCQAEY